MLTAKILYIKQLSVYIHQNEFKINNKRYSQEKC